MNLSKQVLKLVESNDDWKKYLHNYKGQSTAIKWFEKAEEIISSAEKSGQIRNVEFKEAKDILSSVLDHSVQPAMKEINKNRGGDGDIRFAMSYDDFAYKRSQYPSAKKVLDKTDNEDLKQLNRELFVHLYSWYERLIALKPKIVMGRAPNPNAKPAYVPPMSSRKSLAIVEEAYEKILKEWFPQQVKEYIDIKLAEVEKAEKAISDKDEKLMKVFKVIINKCFKYGVRKSESELHKILKEEAEPLVKSIQEQFKLKNMKKITSIVGEKGNLAKVRIYDMDFKNNIRASADIQFDDGTSFTAISKIVTVWPYGGMPFNRFPLTFHNVKFLDGKVHKMRSEEQMNTDFAKEGK